MFTSTWSGTKTRIQPGYGGKRFCICWSCIWVANGTAFKGDTDDKSKDYLRYPIAIEKCLGGTWLLNYYCMIMEPLPSFRMQCNKETAKFFPAVVNRDDSL